MAAVTAVHPGDMTPPERRQEVLEWHQALATRSDAELLGIRAGARPAEIRAAFVMLARRFHPDTAGPDEPDLRRPLQDILIRITEAHRNLSERAKLSRVYAPEPRPQRRKAPSVAQPAAAKPAPAASPARRSDAADAAERRARVELALRAAQELVSGGKTDEAVAALHEVLTQADEPRRRRIRLLLARAYAVDARHRRYGVALLRELVAQGPHDAEALAALAALYRSEGLLARAEPLFARALALDPGLAAAREGLRAVRAALAAKRPSDPNPPVRRRGLLARLFSVAR